jgi:hypothetical protein
MENEMEIWDLPLFAFRANTPIVIALDSGDLSSGLSSSIDIEVDGCMSSCIEPR